MKPIWKLILVLFTTAGCAGMVTTPQSNQRSNNFSYHASVPPAPGPMFPSNTEPQPVLPTTGGPPVIGIPIGGNMYLPIIGGPPVIGIPLTP
jgi:hypothetical protein